MFEKEAKRSFDELDDRGAGDDWSIEESYVNGFSNGAEFGYNKGLKAKINTTTVSDYPAMEYAKTIIKDLLDNSDEYARQRAYDFLKEVSE